MNTLGDSLKRITSELATVVHAAIEDIVESVIYFDKMIGYTTADLEELSSEPEVSRKCPFCMKQLSEHYDVGSHIAQEHPKEAMKKYKESIEYYYHHPEDVSERYKTITKLFTFQDYVHDDEILCPFCEKPFSEYELKRHVHQKHDEFMETFYNVLKEG